MSDLQPFYGKKACLSWERVCGCHGKEYVVVMEKEYVVVMERKTGSPSLNEKIMMRMDLWAGVEKSLSSSVLSFKRRKSML